MIVYFSGTGNSRFAANVLAKQLKEEALDAGKRIKEGQMDGLHSKKPWIFVAPTYAWRLPHLFTDYLEKIQLTGSREAYFVLTCGSEIGNAGAYAARLCAEKGLVYRGILEVVMPENYIAMFSAPEEEEARKIVSKARPVLETGAALIRQGKPFPAYKVGVLDRFESNVANEGFYRFFLKADDFYARESCVGCGKCVEACPLNNVRLENGRPLWGGSCTHCMACICGCPTGAIEYGKKSRGKPRYQCPEDGG